MLSEAPDRVLRMTHLAARTNATLPRLSHVVSRLEDRGLVERRPCPGDRRATNARLTEAGWRTLEEAAPGHVEHVRQNGIDALTPEQVGQLAAIAEAILGRLDPDGKVTPRSPAGRSASAAGRSRRPRPSARGRRRQRRAAGPPRTGPGSPRPARSGSSPPWRCPARRG